MKKSVVFLLPLLVMCGPVFAQTTQQTDVQTVAVPVQDVAVVQQPEQPTESKPPKPGTYFKVQVSHGDFDLYGSNYRFNDLAVEIEEHWAKRHAGFAGFSVGYRKEDFAAGDYGHYVNGKFFWKAETHGFFVKPGLGVEWGKPSPRFEQTSFTYKSGALASYRRVYIERNAWMPVGVKDTGTLYPFFDVSIGQKVGPLLLEAGTRVGIDKFIVDTFQFNNGSLVFQGLDGEYRFVPTVYVGVGVRLF